MISLKGRRHGVLLLLLLLTITLLLLLLHPSTSQETIVVSLHGSQQTAQQQTAQTAQTVQQQTAQQNPKIGQNKQKTHQELQAERQRRHEEEFAKIRQQIEQLNTQRSSNHHGSQQQLHPIRHVPNLELFSRLISENFARRRLEQDVEHSNEQGNVENISELNQNFLNRFTHDSTHFSSFLFGYHTNTDEMYTRVGAKKLPLSVTGKNRLVEQFARSKQQLFDYEVHCTGPIFKSGDYEACEAMWLIVQMGHWMRLQVHGINLIKASVHKSSGGDGQVNKANNKVVGGGGPMLDEWTSYYNHVMLSMQAYDELLPIQYRRDDISTVDSQSDLGVITLLFKEWMSAHEIIPITYYTVRYYSDSERSKLRSQHSPHFFIPVLFNETGGGEMSGFFTKDVEFAVPFRTTVQGLDQAREQYSDFMKNVERVFMYLEGPIHLKPTADEHVISASVALSYLVYTKDQYPHGHVIVRGIAFVEVDKRKSTKQFSSYKFLFNQ